MPAPSLSHDSRAKSLPHTPAVSRRDGPVDHVAHSTEKVNAFLSTHRGRFQANARKIGGMRVPATVRRSPTAGLGVFVDVAVAKGTLTWQFNKSTGLDFGSTLKECLTMVESLRLSTPERHYVLEHAYGFYRDGPGAPATWRLGNDMSDYTNHRRPGPQLSVRGDGAISMAAFDLKRGTELLENYENYAPVPAWAGRCISSQLPSLAERCARLTKAGSLNSYCRDLGLGNVTPGYSRAFLWAPLPLFVLLVASLVLLYRCHARSLGTSRAALGSPARESSSSSS